MKQTLLGFLFLALLVAPLASAAEASFSDAALTIPPTGSADLIVTVTVDCAEILAANNDLKVPVSTTGLPDWFGAGTAEASFALTDCAPPSVSASKDVTLTFTPTADAFGLDPYGFTVNAGTDSAPYTGPIQVGYLDGHQISSDMEFPYVLTDADEGRVTWNVTIDVTANSQTMVMFQNLQYSVGKVSGISHQIFDVETEDTTRTLTATFEAPDFEWEEATITFWNYSHCLKGTDCPPTNSQNLTWVIQNGAGGPSNGGGDGKDSPGLAPVTLTIALVAITLLARRRA